MYTDEDVEAAIAEGVFDTDTARRFRALADRRRPQPVADEERFRMLTGFNDIFVSIAAGLLLFAVAGLLGRDSLLASGLGIAACSWALAEYFTRVRRMALPSILLLLSFVGGAFTTGLALAGVNLSEGPTGDETAKMMPLIVASALASAAAYGHWRRFMVPITVAAGAATVLGALVAGLFAAAPVLLPFYLWFMLAAGLCLFLLGLWWDASDRDRQTRRADVAFWLHLVAAPLIIHPVFAKIGLTPGSGDTMAAALAIGLYLVIGLVSLIIDRRAMLVSALIYVMIAMNTLLELTTAPELQFMIAALVIGSMLLLLSASWHQARAMLLKILPTEVRAVLPAG